jgi:hypothetical protein
MPVQSTLRGKRYRATIVPTVLLQKSYRNRPSKTRAEELEIDQRDVQQMMSKLNGKPMCYNHDSNFRIGRVVANYQSARDKSWMVEFELDDTPFGKTAKEHIEAGRIRGISLAHWPEDNDPDECSACFEGARGPESRIHADPSDSKHIDRPLVAASRGNTNAQSGTISNVWLPFYRAPHKVSASGQASSSSADELKECTELHLAFMSKTEPVQGSEMATGDEQKDQNHSHQQEQKQQPPPGSSAAAGGGNGTAPVLTFKRKDGSTATIPAKGHKAATDTGPAAQKAAPTPPKQSSDMQIDNEGQQQQQQQQPPSAQNSADLIKQLQEQQEQLAAELQNKGLTTEQFDALVQHLSKRDTLTVQAEIRAQQAQQELQQLRAANKAREDAERAARDEGLRKQAEEEEQAKTLELKIAMDFMATYDESKTPEEKQAYFDSLKSLPLASIKALTSAQNKAMEMQNRQASINPTTLTPHMQQLMSMYKNSITPPVPALPPAFDSSMQQQSGVPSLTNPDGGPVQASYQGESRLRSKEFDVDAWISQRVGNMVFEPRMLASTPSARKVLASVSTFKTEEQVFQSAKTHAQNGSDQMNAPERAVWFRGQRVNTKPICAAAAEEQAQANLHVPMGAGCRFPMVNLGANLHRRADQDRLVKATLAVWAGPGFDGSAEPVSTSIPLDANDLYSVEFMKTMTEWGIKNANTSNYQETGNESYGNAMAY